MATVKQDMKRFQLIEGCKEAIRRHGALARITIILPGTTNRLRKRRVSAKGPRGDIIMHTVDKKRALVQFAAAPLQTSMEAIRNGYITG